MSDEKHTKAAQEEDASPSDERVESEYLVDATSNDIQGESFDNTQTLPNLPLRGLVVYTHTPVPFNLWQHP